MSGLTAPEIAALKRLARASEESLRPPIATKVVFDLRDRGLATTFDSVKSPPPGTTFGDTSCVRARITQAGRIVLHYIDAGVK